MKYWRGYLTAGILAAITWAVMQLGEQFNQLVDMVYPYVMRTMQDMLAAWSSSVDFCLWQLVVLVLILVVLATLVLALVLKWNIFQWFGWVLTAAASLFLVHTLVWGLNYYAGPLADDIRMEVQEEYSASDLADAAAYYRDMANELAGRIPRDGNKQPKYSDFEVLAESAGYGFDVLVHEYYYPVFAGTDLPVKKLGWANLYTSMGITGVTMGVTGEAAVNPQIPDVSLPFTICHEMAHRKCIATEQDANFSAFLACMAHENVQFRYSGYFMAYRYCLNALYNAGTQEAAAAAARVSQGANALLSGDMADYTEFFDTHRDDRATAVATSANDTYLKTSGDEQGVASYDAVADLLYSWYYQEIVVPNQVVPENPFDPFDETQVDLSGLPHAPVPETTAPEGA